VDFIFMVEMIISIYDKGYIIRKVDKYWQDKTNLPDDTMCSEVGLYQCDGNNNLSKFAAELFNAFENAYFMAGNNGYSFISIDGDDEHYRFERKL